MRFTYGLVSVLLATPSIASPVVKREYRSDADILNYALTLEFLERKFYQQGLANYTQKQFVDAGFPEPFYARLQEIASDERTHVDFLRGAISRAGLTAVNEAATYNFPSTDVKSFVTLSSILEGVGVSAYLGAAASILEKSYLTAAATILTVEARHSAFIRNAIGQEPFPNPFDTPLSFNSVFSLAAPFIGKFAPNDPALPFKPFPALTLAAAPYYESGKTPISFTGAAKAYAQPNGAPVYAAFFSGLAPQIIPTTVSGDDLKVHALPEGISGQTYIVLTKNATAATDDYVLAGPALLEVYATGKAPASK